MADLDRDAALLRKRYAALAKNERINAQGVAVDARSRTPLGLVVARVVGFEGGGGGTRRARLRVARGSAVYGGGARTTRAVRADGAATGLGRAVALLRRRRPRDAPGRFSWNQEFHFAAVPTRDADLALEVLDEKDGVVGSARVPLADLSQTAEQRTLILRGTDAVFVEVRFEYSKSVAVLRQLARLGVGLRKSEREALANDAAFLAKPEADAPEPAKPKVEKVERRPRTPEELSKVALRNLLRAPATVKSHADALLYKRRTLEALIAENAAFVKEARAQEVLDRVAGVALPRDKDDAGAFSIWLFGASETWRPLARLDIEAVRVPNLGEDRSYRVAAVLTRKDDRASTKRLQRYLETHGASDVLAVSRTLSAADLAASAGVSLALAPVATARGSVVLDLLSSDDGANWRRDARAELELGALASQRRERLARTLTAVASSDHGAVASYWGGAGAGAAASSMEIVAQLRRSKLEPLLKRGRELAALRTRVEKDLGRVALGDPPLEKLDDLALPD